MQARSPITDIPKPKGIQKKKNKILFLCLLGFVTLIIAFFGLLIGPSSLTFKEGFLALFGQGEDVALRIVWNIRMPRVLAGLLAGASLAVSGLIMQTTLGNIMASPSTLGVSNAAIFGANISMILVAGGFIQTGNNPKNLTAGLNPYAASGMALVFALISILIILALSTIRKFSPNVVVLAGIGIGAVWTAGTSLLQYYASDVGLTAAVVWNFGDLSRATYQHCLLMFGVLIVAVTFFVLFSWRYNALLGGEEYAKSLGVRTSLLRFISLFLASVLTAVSISILGVIGFVGIICPHIIRRIIGHDHRFSISGSLIAGSFLLVLADLIGRLIGGGGTLPVGAITAIIGAPFFLYLIFAKREEPHA